MNSYFAPPLPALPPWVMEEEGGWAIFQNIYLGGT